MNKTALDQYEEIVTDALKSCSAKLRKSFKMIFCGEICKNMAKSLEDTR